jgi:hypothetical protein
MFSSFMVYPFPGVMMFWSHRCDVFFASGLWSVAIASA